MFRKNRLFSKFACGLLCLTLAMPGQALTAYAADPSGEVTEDMQQDAISQGSSRTMEEILSDSEGLNGTSANQNGTSDQLNGTSEDLITDENTETVEDELSQEASDTVEDVAKEEEEVKEDAEEAEKETVEISKEGLPEIQGDYYRQYAATLYADQILKFVDPVTESAEETAVPADDTAAPADDAAVPADDASAPAEETVAPADDAAAPADSTEAAAPASETSTPKSSVTLSVDGKTKKLVVSGSKDDLMTGEISIAKTFHFDGKAVARFSFDASAAKGQKITLGFYLDDSAEPFATKELIKQRKKGTWEFQRDFSVDTLGMNLTGDHTLKIKVLDSSDSKPSFCLNWFEFVESSVPVIYVNIDEADGTIGEMNSSEDHSAECYGSMSIKVPAGYTSVDSGKALSGGDYNLEYIRGRGNSTWNASKKPYKIKLSDGAKLLGMGKNKHWVLLANYYDNSLLRNRMTYWLGKQLGMPYTPNLEPVELVMNGEYYGSYFLSEQVRLDKNRVDLKDLEKTPEATEEDEITGGYLLSMFPYGNEETKKSIRTKKGVEYLIESPEFDGYENEAQVNYISNYLQSVEDALYNKDFKTEDGVRYSDLMDLKSTALYYWIQEFSMNGDGYVSGSTYLYKPDHDKLYWGPLWDFDFVAWGSTEYSDLYTEGWTQKGEEDYANNWNSRLLEDAEFGTELLKGWELLKPLLQQVTAPGGQMDSYAADMEITARYNFEKLDFSPLGQEDDPSYSGYAEGETISPKTSLNMPGHTYADEITRLKDWIDRRLVWVDNNVESLRPVETTVTFKDDNGNVIESRTGIIGRPMRSLPEVPVKEGYLFSHWEYNYTMTLDFFLNLYEVKTEEELRNILLHDGWIEEEVDDFIQTYKDGVEASIYVDENTAIEKDMVITPRYVDNRDITHPKKIFLNKKIYTGIAYQYEEGGYLPDPIMQVAPFYAYDGDVKFTTDNENVVKFDKYNNSQVVGPGECTLIARASNGVEARAKIIIYSEQEAEENGMIFDVPAWFVEEKATVQKGKHYQLKFELSNELGMYGEGPSLFTADEDIVQIGQAGVIRAMKPGIAHIICISNDIVSICKVTVPATPGSLGSNVVKNGIKYKVTDANAKSRKVACMGPEKKSIKKASIPSTITINGKKYKVTKIKDSAFKNCKSLTSVSIGKYVEIINGSAFLNCKKLTKITIYASQPKIFKSSFKGIPKKATFSVPKKAKKYFDIVLKGKKLVTHK
ncbi:MAG: CotH kinase family protein [Dorea sp.]|nr:CotH kinase family protein [Dorea sp.]